MPFPFMPIGILTGAAVLGVTFALVYVLVTKLDRAFGAFGGAVVGRLVSGFDDWSHDRSRPVATAEVGRREDAVITRLPGDPPSFAATYEESAAIPVEPARQDRA